VKALYDAENEFWNKNVKERIMPEIDGSESTKQAIYAMHPESKEKSKIDLTSDADEYIRMLAGYKLQEKEMESKINEYENKLKLMIGDNETGFTDKHRVTWKSQSGRITLDSKKIKAELPDVYEKYKKVGKPIRKLNIYDLE
jgi:predicted phage-related endonuclease